MGSLVFSTTASLDGFVAGVGGDLSWLADHVSALRVDLDALLAPIGALLVGRRTWDGDDPNRGTDAEGAFGGRWHGTSVLLTHHPPAVVPDDVVVAGDLEAAVAAARAAADGRDVHVLGADVAAQCLAAGHLDEVLLFTAPVLRGDGVGLFRRPGGTRIRLEAIDPAEAGPDARRYRVVR